MRERVDGIRHIGAGYRGLGSVANRARLAAKDLAESIERRKLAAAGPTVAERQAELLAFYDRFERFVEILCDAAQYGPNPRLESAYAEERTLMTSQYEPLRPYVGAFLAPEEPEAFDRLFSAEDLHSFLAEDDGTAIFRITTTRDALSMYAEHLRQLSARKML